MPFYLANPRKGSFGTQRRQQSSRVDYFRTEPTQFLYFANTTEAPYVQREVLPSVLHGAIFAYLGSSKLKKPVWVEVDGASGNYAVPNSSCPPIILPSVSIMFTDDPSEETVKVLQDNNAQMHDIARRGRLYTLQVTAANFNTIVALEGVDLEATPISQTIPLSALTPVINILRHISSVALVLSAYYAYSGVVRVSINAKTTTSKAQPLILLGETAEVEKDVEYTSSNEEENMFVYVDASNLDKVPLYGDISRLPNSLNYGVFLPFEPNYSKVDFQAWGNFANAFPAAVNPNDDEDQGEYVNDLQESWVKMARTYEGEWLGHMMGAVMMAKKTQSGVFFLMRGGIYEGTLLYKGKKFTLKTRSVECESLTKDALLSDITSYSSHSKSLQAILTEVAIPGATLDSFTTMRGLREAVFGRFGGGIPTSTKSILEKNLGFLNFAEKPVNINPQTLGTFARQIKPDSATPIPTNAYMDRRYFFSTDRVELALCQFGSFVPSPAGNGKAHPLVLKSDGRITGVGKAPNLLKFQMKGVAQAAVDWKGFLKTGTLYFDEQGRGRNQRIIRNAEAITLGGILTEVASESMKTTESSFSGKRKRNETGDEVPEEGGPARPSKAPRVIPPNPFA